VPRSDKGANRKSEVVSGKQVIKKYILLSSRPSSVFMLPATDAVLAYVVPFGLIMITNEEK